MSPLRRFWLSNFFVGVGKFLFLQIGRLIWGYSRWHCSPVNRKPYALEIIETLEEMLEAGTIGSGYIVEVGCGRGDIIGNIRYGKRIGIDIDPHAISAAKFLHPDMTFIEGEIDAIPVDNIDALIMVGWLHGISPEIVHEWLCPVLPKTKIFIFDVFLDEYENPLSGYVDENSHAYTHDGQFLCDGKYELILKGKSLKSSTVGRTALRRMEYWMRKNTVIDSI